MQNASIVLAEQRKADQRQRMNALQRVADRHPLGAHHPAPCLEHLERIVSANIVNQHEIPLQHAFGHLDGQNGVASALTKPGTARRSGMWSRSYHSARSSIRPGAALAKTTILCLENRSSAPESCTPCHLPHRTAGEHRQSNTSYPFHYSRHETAGAGPLSRRPSARSGCRRDRENTPSARAARLPCGAATVHQ